MKKVRKLDPSRIKQRETFLERYGREKYAEAGRKGAQKRWNEYRKQKEKQSGLQDRSS